MFIPGVWILLPTTLGYSQLLSPLFCITKLEGWKNFRNASPVSNGNGAFFMCELPHILHPVTEITGPRWTRSCTVSSQKVTGYGTLASHRPLMTDKSDMNQPGFYLSCSFEVPFVSPQHFAYSLSVSASSCLPCGRCGEPRD